MVIYYGNLSWEFTVDNLHYIILYYIYSILYIILYNILYIIYYIVFNTMYRMVVDRLTYGVAGFTISILNLTHPLTNVMG